MFTMRNTVLKEQTTHMYLRSITSQDFQTILKTLFKSRYLFLVFLLSANAAAIAAEVSDLGVETVRVSRTTLHPGETFRLETLIRNHGKAAATPATLSYHVSPDDTISREDTEIQTETVPRIAAGGTLERSVHLTAPDTPGTYYYGVCVNSVAAEADTTHNCSSATAITVKGADLMIFDAPQLSKNTVKSGETLSGQHPASGTEGESLRRRQRSATTSQRTKTYR